MLDKIKQLMEVRKQAEQIKKELEATDVEVRDVPGVTITISGSQNFKSIMVEESLLNDKEKLENSLLNANNAAIRASQKLAAEKMKDVTGMDLPGM